MSHDERCEMTEGLDANCYCACRTEVARLRAVAEVARVALDATDTLLSDLDGGGHRREAANDALDALEGALATLDAAQPPEAPQEPTRDTEREALVREVGECCGGGDPLCGGGCLVIKALQNRGLPPDDPRLATLRSLLAPLRELAGKATPGPWNDCGEDGITQTQHLTRDVWVIPRTVHDVSLIVAAVNLVPALLTALGMASPEAGSDARATNTTEA